MTDWRWAMLELAIVAHEAMLQQQQSLTSGHSGIARNVGMKAFKALTGPTNAAEPLKGLSAPVTSSADCLWMVLPTPC